MNVDLQCGRWFAEEPGGLRIAPCFPVFAALFGPVTISRVYKCDGFHLHLQKNLARMLRVAMWIPVFAALFGPVSDRAAGVHTVYYVFLRV